MDLSQNLKILQCPRCRQGTLTLQREKLSCASCSREFPVIRGIPNFLLPDSAPFQYDRWLEAQTYERAFWDSLKSKEKEFDSGPGHDFWKKHAEAQYAKFLQFHKNVPPQACLEIGGGNVPRIAYVPAGTKVALDPLMSYQTKLFPEIYQDILCMDAMAESIPLADNSVDYAVLSNCLDHFSRPDLALKEVFRVLRPDGVVFIGLETFTPLWKIWHKYRDKTHPYRWTAREQQELISRNGGAIAYFEVDPPPVREYHQAIASTFRIRLALALKKMQESWIFAKKL